MIMCRRSTDRMAAVRRFDRFIWLNYRRHREQREDAGDIGLRVALASRP